MEDLSLIAPDLVRDADGIWRAATTSAVDYPDQANAFCFAVEAESFWFNYRNRFILEVVRHFPPEGPIADIGAGNGYVSLALQRAGFPTIVIEPGPVGARNARSRGLEPVVCATLQDAHLASHSLAAAGLFDVLEHVEDDTGFLRDVRRLLKPGGRLYLTVPALRALWSTEDALAGHHHRYTLGQLENRLRASGFIIEYATYLFAPLIIPLFLFRTLPSWLGSRTSLDSTQIAAELRPPSAPALKVATALLDVEVALVKRRRRIPLGTSCLVAATAVR